MLELEKVQDIDLTQPYCFAYKLTEICSKSHLQEVTDLNIEPSFPISQVNKACTFYSDLVFWNRMDA